MLYIVSIKKLPIRIQISYHTADIIVQRVKRVFKIDTRNNSNKIRWMGITFFRFIQYKITRSFCCRVFFLYKPSFLFYSKKTDRFFGEYPHSYIRISVISQQMRIFKIGYDKKREILCWINRKGAIPIHQVAFEIYILDTDY